MIADSPALAPDVSYYQRLLARDQSEAAEHLSRHLANNPPEGMYDALLVPGFNYAEQDRMEGASTMRTSVSSWEATRELMADATRSAIGRVRTQVAEREDARGTGDATETAVEAGSDAACRGVPGQWDGRRRSRSACSPIFCIASPLRIRDPLLAPADLRSREPGARPRGATCSASPTAAKPRRPRHATCSASCGRNCRKSPILVGRWAPAAAARRGTRNRSSMRARRTWPRRCIETRDQLCRLVSHERHRTSNSDAA